MKKRIWASILAVCLVLTMLPTVALADSDGNAGTLQAKIDAATSGQTITLDGNYTESITIASGKNITLDLSSYKLTNESGKDTITVALGGTLTITGNGTVDNVSHQCAAIYNNGTTILNGGSYTRSAEASKTTEDANGNSYYNILNHGVMTINVGVSVTSSGSFSSLIDNGYYDYTSTNPRVGYVSSTGQEKPSLTINGGTFSGGINTVKNDDNATVVINDGTFSNVTQAVVFNANKAEINGGIFNVNTEGNNSEDELYAVFNCNYNSGTNVVNTKITDGTFNGEVYNSNVAVLTISGGTFTNSVTSANSSNISISGGTFSEEINTEYLADGYTTTDEEGTNVVGKKTEAGEGDVAVVNGQYFTTLAGALAAANNGDTVTLLKDIELSTSVIVRNEITLDLNDCSVTRGSGNGRSWLIGVAQGAALTIQDTGTEQKGQIYSANFTGTNSSGEEVTYAGYSVLTNGALSVKSGTLSGYTGIVCANSDTDYTVIVDISGGTIKGTDGSGIQIQGNQAALKDGETLEDKDAYPVKVTVSGDANISAVWGVTLWGKGAELAVNGGTIEGTSFAISGNGTYSDKNNQSGTKITITDGVIKSTGETGTAIYHPQYGTLDISGGEITGPTGIEIRAGELTMTGGNVTGTSAPTEVEPNGNGTTSDGAGIAVSQHTTMLPIIVNITGGEINGYSAFYQVDTLEEMKNNDGSNRYNTDQLKAAYEKIELTIAGGDFVSTSNADNAQAVYSEKFTQFIYSGNFSDPVDPEYLDEKLNAELVKSSGDAPYSYYTSVEKALEDAKPGDTVNDLNNDEEGGTVPAVTLDYGYGNKTITVNTNSITLPTLSNYGYNYFQGWTDKDGKFHKAGEIVTITANTTFTAQWVYIPPVNPNPSYSITVPSVDNGTLAVTPSNASKNTDVTITVTPDKDYELASLTVVDANGNRVPVKQTGENKFTFTMPASKVTVNASFSKIVKELPFTDVSANDYFFDAVVWAVENGVTYGNTATTFGVGVTCNRADAVTFIWRAYGCPAPKSSENPFTDVADSAYYADAVLWAVENGITVGTSATTFSPLESCRREHIVTFLYRAAGSPTVSHSSGFSDVADSAYYANAVTWAAENGITVGAGSTTTFGPTQNCFREQIVTFLYRNLAE